MIETNLIKIQVTNPQLEDIQFQLDIEELTKELDYPKEKPFSPVDAFMSFVCLLPFIGKAWEWYSNQ